MKLIFPVTADNQDEAELTKIADAPYWVQLTIFEGRVSNVEFSKDSDGFSELSDGVVVCDDGEYVWPFIELGMMVLVAQFQRTIDDIVEAYLFKELNELAY